MNDQQKLEIITGCFTACMLHNKMEDLGSYRELKKRVWNLIEAEMRWNNDRSWDTFLMSAWGPKAN